MSDQCSIVVLISGSGSNLQALIDDARSNGSTRIRAVISNREDAYGLQRACQAGIPSTVLDHKDFPDRETFDQALMGTIDGYQPQLVVLAGFMRILSAEFVRHYAGRLLNIHPSLLPSHKGLNTHQRVLDAGDTEHGCTVHFVTEELDGGPLIAQAVLAVAAHDDSETLAERVHQLEHRLYPMVVRWFADGRLRLAPSGAMLDGQSLPACGYQIRN